MGYELAVSQIKSLALLEEAEAHAGVCLVEYEHGEFIVRGEGDHEVGTVNLEEHNPGECTEEINRLVEEEHNRL